MNEPLMMLTISLLVFVAAYLLVRYGYAPGRQLWLTQEGYYDRVLRQRLLIDIEPRLAVILNLAAVAVALMRSKPVYSLTPSPSRSTLSCVVYEAVKPSEKDFCRKPL